MTYEGLINKLSGDNNITITEKSYSEQSFGDYLVKFEYKGALQIKIVNDRGIIEMSVLSGSLISQKEIPLVFAVGFV